MLSSGMFPVKARSGVIGNQKTSSSQKKLKNILKYRIPGQKIGIFISSLHSCVIGLFYPVIKHILVL